MRKIIPSILSVFVALFFSCTDFRGQDSASLSIILPQTGGRSIVFTRGDAAFYTIALCTEYGSVSDSIDDFTGGTASFEDIDAGRCKVMVTDFSLGNLVVATGSSEIFEIGKNESKTIAIKMEGYGLPLPLTWTLPRLQAPITSQMQMS